MFGVRRLIYIASCVCSFALLLIIFFLTALSLRVDRKIDWNYAIVFIPVWVAACLSLVGLVVEFVLFQLKTSDEGEGEEETSSDDSTRQTRMRGKLVKMVSYLSRLLALLLDTTFHILVVLKANDPSSIPAVLLFAPYFSSRGIETLTRIVTLSSVLKMTEGTQVPFISKLAVVIQTLWEDIVVVPLAVLIMLRIDSRITWSWFLVFSPLYLVAVKLLVSYIVEIGLASMQEDEARRSALKREAIASAIVYIVLYGILGLLAAKLDGFPVSALLITAPFIGVCAIGFCFTACCLPCIFRLAQGSGDDLGSGAIRV
ncbi:hypothetical protein BGX28_010431 [Mortierella sp. GBA30]|nr:hypothetical protein BGX28_010431 [Mortierella sp. GBA30]